MEAGEPPAERLEFSFAQRCFDAGEDFILLEPHVIVEQPRQRGDLVFIYRPAFECGLQPLDSRADFGVVGKHAHDVFVAIEPRVASEGGQQYFFLFAEMQMARALPEAQEFLGYPPERRRALCG